MSWSAGAKIRGLRGGLGDKFAGCVSGGVSAPFGQFSRAPSGFFAGHFYVFLIPLLASFGSRPRIGAPKWAPAGALWGWAPIAKTFEIVRFGAKN